MADDGDLGIKQNFYISFFLYSLCLIAFNSNLIGQDTFSQFLVAYGNKSTDKVIDLAKPDTSLPFLVTGPYYAIDFPSKSTAGSLIDLLYFEKGYKALTQNPMAKVTAVVSEGRGALTALRALASKPYPTVAAAIIDSPPTAVSSEILSSLPTTIPLLLIYRPGKDSISLADMVLLTKMLLEKSHKDLYFVELPPLYSANSTYTNIAHAFYAKYNIDHDPELAKQGKSLLEQAEVTQESLTKLNATVDELKALNFLDIAPELEAGALATAVAGAYLMPDLAPSVVNAWVGFESALGIKAGTKQIAKLSPIVYLSETIQKYLPPFLDVHTFIKGVIKVALSNIAKYLVARILPITSNKFVGTWYDAGIKTLILQEAGLAFLRSIQALMATHNEELFDLGLLASAVGYFSSLVGNVIGAKVVSQLPKQTFSILKDIARATTITQTGDIFRYG
ncbi:MAG TPA: hypothetical protein VHA52_10160, partial [Candidatus Babeliaceae bacterium]|nr:hypothetical protein [Candidatus Babeliaceae bacterium]